MKKILLLLTSLATLNVISQSSILLSNNGNSLTPNYTVYATVSAGNLVTVVFDIKNTSGSTHSYNVKRYDVLLNAAGGSTASAYFCFAGSCYAAGTYTSPTPLTLNAGQSASQSTVAFTMLNADLDEANAAGPSIVKYTVYNASQSSDSAMVTIRYNSPTSINESSQIVSSFDLWPNPATDAASIKIQSTRNAEGKLCIYNTLGAIIYEKPVSLNEGKNKIDLNTENYSTGIYFASLRFGNSAVTKKFVVK